MTVQKLKNITRKDVPVYYKMFYKAVAEIELLGKAIDVDIEFSLEMKPIGTKEALVSILSEIDYPLVPLISEIKKTILALDREAQLPL